MRRQTVAREGSSHASAQNTSRRAPNAATEHAALSSIRESLVQLAIPPHEVRALLANIAQRSPRLHGNGEKKGQGSATSLPAQAPELYRSRSDRSETPVAFLERVWGGYLKAGLLYQFQLRAFDPDLVAAINSYCQARNLDRKTILPPPKRMFTEAVAATIGADKSVLRAASILYRRTQSTTRK